MPNVFWGTRGAGILPICEPTKRALLALRSPYVMEPNTWGIWGGKIDDDDLKPSEAALRELSEETEFYGNVSLYKAFVFESNKADFTYYNFIGVLDKEFEPKLNWETSDFLWLDFDGLIKLKPKHFGLSALLKDPSSITTIKKFML